MRKLSLLALIFLSGASAAAQTRPLITEAATTAPAGTLVFETGFDLIQSEPNFLTGRERDVWAGPLLRFVYSPSDDVELDLEWVARVGQREDPDFGDSSDFGDVTLRAKWRFAGERAGRPAIGARFSVTLPETSFGDGLGRNTLRMSAQLLLSKSAGGLTFHANAGLALLDEPLRAHEQRDLVAYGVALELRLAPRLRAVAEIAGLAGKGSPGADAHSEARAGLRVGEGRLRGDVAVRVGLGDADGNVGLTGGFTWRARPR